jgi:hypothetical protein
VILGLLMGGLLPAVRSIEQAKRNKTAVYSAAVHYLFHLQNSEMSVTPWQTIYVSPRETTVIRSPFVYSRNEGEYVPNELLSALSDLAPHITFATVDSLLPPGQVPQMPDHTIVITLSPINLHVNGAVEIDVEYYRGFLDGAGYKVYLAYDGRNWSVQNIEMPWIS